MRRGIQLSVATLGAALWMASATYGQSASTGVDVGAGHASAHGAAAGHWQMVDSQSRVGPFGNMGRALAVGMGPNGLAISHSIGVHGARNGAAHNFNLSVGPNGTHVSRGGVNAHGPGARVIAGGQTHVPTWGPPQGGSSVAGFGRNVHAHSRSSTIPSVGAFPGVGGFPPPMPVPTRARAFIAGRRFPF